MELKRSPNSATKQTVDSIRSYQEYRRVSRELKALGGTMYWHSVGKYEYLVQKRGRKLQYEGRRSPETERQLEEFLTRRKYLQERLVAMQGTIETAQRLNSAVRAGTTPTQVIDALQKVDELGLTESSVVVGAPALDAYFQASGMRLESSKTLHKQSGQDVELAKHDLWLFIAQPKEQSSEEAKKGSSVSLVQLKKSLGRFGDVRSTSTTKGKGGTFVVYIKTYSSQDHHKSSASSLRISNISMFKDIGEIAPAYESVVIGKTGKMAVMRTLDPLLYSTACKYLGQHVESPALRESLTEQAKVVDTLLSQHLVLSEATPIQHQEMKSRLSSMYPSEPVMH